jgi:hypothetical protein
MLPLQPRDRHARVNQQAVAGVNRTDELYSHESLRSVRIAAYCIQFAGLDHRYGDRDVSACQTTIYDGAGVFV